MSDMSRPMPLHTAPDHELHDPLLVAQHAAGDALDPADRARADLWTASCAACASLAADLRAVSGAVAWEPTPRRRRDYRLSVEQAAALRGNRFSRFMRRLALPQSSMLRPAAAGALSIGLLMVVASSAWPGDDIATLTSAPEQLPAVGPAPAAEAVPGAGAFRLEASPMPGGQDTAAEVDALLGPSVEEPRDAAGALADEPQAPPERARAGDRPTEETATDAVAGDDADALPFLRSEAANSSVILEEDGEARAVELEAPGSFTEEQARKAAADAFARQSGTVFEDDDRRDPDLFAGADDAGLSLDEAEGRAAPDSAGDETAESAVDPQQPAAGSTTTVADDSVATVTSVPADSGLDEADLLLAVGSALAIAGGLLLLLTWLARRRTDPLLR